MQCAMAIEESAGCCMMQLYRIQKDAQGERRRERGRVRWKRVSVEWMKQAADVIAFQ